MPAKPTSAGPLIKICGVTRAEDLLSCHESGVDFVGFNFYSGSKRFIEPKAAFRIWDEFAKKNPGHKLKPVAVAVNATGSGLKNILADFPDLFGIQLHGSETAGLVADVRRSLAIKVWKAVPVADSADLSRIEEMRQVADLVLLDSAAVPHGATVAGGSGKTFDWPQFAGLIGKPDIGVAGGLTPANIGGLLHYNPALVDLASGVETSPGVKSREMIESLVKACRTTASS